MAERIVIRGNIAQHVRRIANYEGVTEGQSETLMAAAHELERLNAIFAEIRHACDVASTEGYALDPNEIGDVLEPNGDTSGSGNAS